MDTNVPAVANGRDSIFPLECQLKCIVRLEAIVAQCRVFIDERGLIMEEYARHLSYAGQPGVGDRFFRHLFQNQANPSACRRIAIPIRVGDGEFEAFPRDARLANFDRADRKFVAVALASGHSPAIQNATDSDWNKFERILALHGVRVDNIC
ncbi:MAG TPA: hypothetical protein VLV50_01940 [Stellaceae bacterium]|nr:hypothetical protein [Stellaceae bacterium]